MPQSRYFRPVYMPRPRLPYRPAASRAGANVGDIGKGVTDLMGAIQKSQAAAKLQQQQQQQNDIANRLMNTSNPLLGTVAPRAAYVPGVDAAQRAADASRAGVSPATLNVLKAGVSTQGTAPITGGLNEIAVRQQLINQAIDEAKLRNALGSGGGGAGARGPIGPAYGSRSGWARQGVRGAASGGGRASAGGTRAATAGGGGSGKAAPVDTNAALNPAQYNFDTLHKQFDSQYGKIANYDTVSPYFNNIHPQYNPNDPKSTPPDTGLWSNGQGGLDYYKNGKLQTSMMANDANYWLNRINTARSNAGQDPIHTPLQGSGTPDDPYVINSPWEYGSVPYNQYFRTTDRPQIGQKLRPEDAPKMAAAQIALGGRGGGGEDYLSSWRGATGGRTTGPDLPAPTPTAPETGGAGYSASFGAQGAAPEAGTEFGPAPNDQAYDSRFNPPIQPAAPDEQAQTARFNPPTLPATDDQAYAARFNPSVPPPSSITPDDQAYTARFNPPPPVPSPPMVPVPAESVGMPPSAGSSGATSYLDSTQFDPNLLMGGT